MSVVLVLALKALAEGTLVVAFAILGERIRPQGLAGLLAAAPSVTSPRRCSAGHGITRPAGENYGLAVATASGVSAHRFVAHRGREGNWGEAVLLAVRFMHSVIGEAQPGSADSSIRGCNPAPIGDLV